MARKSKKSSKPVISVIIPVKAISYYLLFENLPAFDKQTFKRFEVIVLPNEHSTYDLTLLSKYKWLRIVSTGRVTRPAQKRDLGVKESKGSIMAFIDDDAYPDPDWLTNAYKEFGKKKVAAVCGPGELPERATFWEKVFDQILISQIGSGKYRYRFTPLPKRYVIDYPSMNFFVRKKMFQEVGGFNSDYWPGEDSKLCNDILQKKGKIFYTPEVLVYHHRRKDFDGYLYQNSQYGFHRGAFFSHGDRNSREFTYLVPTIFTAYFASIIPVLLTSLLFKTPLLYIHIYSFPLYLYALLLAVFFIQSIAKTQSLLVSGSAVFTLVCTHLVYGISFIKGLKKGLNKEDSIYG